MKILKLIINSILLILLISIALADEVKFEASKMDVTKNGKIIIAKDTNTKIPAEQIEIYSDDALYNKSEQVLNFSQNVDFKDIANDIVIKSNSITYKRKKDLVYSDDETFFYIGEKYKIKSKDVSYDRNLKKIFGSNETIITDDVGNKYVLKENFVFDLINQTLRASSAIILDSKDNKYIFEDLIIKLNRNQIAGKEIKIEFNDSFFGNINNNPELKGRSSYSNDQELKVYKAVFSTCNIENKKCRGWELSADEFNHDKEKKIFEYKNSWLKIFNLKTFYLPYFNHPDPTVKRKSGFLTPSYSSSESLGTSIVIPYFKIIDIDKDMTFSPKYYADKSFLLQNEYRQALEKSNILSDFSFLVGEAGTKSHLFYNQTGNIKNNLRYTLNLQDVKGDNYLKTYKLLNSSPLITDDNLLLSNFDISWNNSDTAFYNSFKIYEDLSRVYHDRFQYILPDFNFRKSLETPEDYKGNFTFNSGGYNKNYNTNINETVLINDFLFESENFFSNYGLKTNYQLLLKNSNSYSKNSDIFEKKENYELYETLKIDSIFPLRKKTNKYTNFFIPKATLRYSPNGNNDISTKDLVLDYNNAFNLNRISTNSQIEGGKSLTLGVEFESKHKDLGNSIKARIGNVIRHKENTKLPTKSKLNKKRSDIFGDINFNLNQYLNLGYLFSYDKDLRYSNLDDINLELKGENFLTNFNYYTLNHDFGNTESLINKTIFNIDNENSIEFSTAEDLKEDFTQYYNLIYGYNTDCLSINFNYNKTFYSDGSLEPDESLSFLIKIIPFTELGVSNFGNIIEK